MSEPVLKIENLTKRFGGFVALDGVDLAVFPGERLGLIGPNGSGKSTLVNCITGVLRHEHGSIRFDGHDLAGLQPHSRTRLGLARSFQIPKPFASMSVLDNLLVPLFYAAHAHDHKARHAGEAAEEAREILRQLGLADKAEQTSATLTQAEMRKLELARAIAARPKLLIADEAMAGLSSTEVDEILDILIDMKARVWEGSGDDFGSTFNDHEIPEELADQAAAYRSALVEAIADLWFHAYVLLAARGLDPSLVEAELERRARS